jgi:hypothetical protein
MLCLVSVRPVDHGLGFGQRVRSQKETHHLRVSIHLREGLKIIGPQWTEQESWGLKQHILHGSTFRSQAIAGWEKEDRQEPDAPKGHKVACLMGPDRAAWELFRAHAIQSGRPRSPCQDGKMQ